MLEKIRQLEKIATRLELDHAERADLLNRAGAYTESFLSGINGMKAFVPDTGRSPRLERAFDEQATNFGTLLDTLATEVDREGINAASGGHMAYIPGGGLYPSAVGDFLADVSNRYAGVSFGSPGAVKLEKQLVRWMCDLVGYPQLAGGDLTSGGSIANLTAIVTAREIMGIRARDVEQSCVYLTEQVHHCVGKSLRAAGLGDCIRRVVPMDNRYRMDVSALEELIKKDVTRGLKPWLITASAGTTDTGAVDPLNQISELAQEHGLWLHVDAAYGGFFLLCEETRAMFQGLEKAHSIVMDPHKGLFLPYGSGAVLVQDVHWLAQSQSYEADYMQDANAGQAEYSPADLSLELSRPFRGLRMWIPLKLHGLAPFRAALTEKIWLARFFHRELESTPDWETGPDPDLSVVTFRYLPKNGNADDFNQRLINAVREDGKVVISSTQLDGKFVMRLAVLHYRTHLKQVEYLLSFLYRKVRELSS